MEVGLILLEVVTVATVVFGAARSRLVGPVAAAVQLVACLCLVIAV
jgi:hypothetical protein